MEHSFFSTALVFLAAAVMFVPLAKKTGLGSVLGYLIAGVVIGPFVMGFVGKEGQDIMHFAEFGVVMMLFLIGLELEPELLWKLRKSILGLGGLQVVLTTVVLLRVLPCCSILYGSRRLRWEWYCLCPQRPLCCKHFPKRGL